VFNRFNEWSKLGIWQQLFDLIRGELDNEWNFMDGTYVKAHQHSAGGIELQESRTIGPSKGGNTTKIHMLADAHGNPIAFEITAGNIHDVSKGEKLIAIAEAENIIADKGYDAEYLRDQSKSKGMLPHIPQRSSNKKPNPTFDKHLYRHRHLIENLFAKLKGFRALATRYDKLTRNYASVVFIVCLFVWLKL
jgi:transposase